MDGRRAPAVGSRRERPRGTAGCTKTQTYVPFLTVMSDREGRFGVHPALLTLAAVIFSLGVLVAACGGDNGSDASPLETYFASVKEAIDDADGEADEVEAGMDTGLANAEDFAGLLAVLGDGVLGFQRLSSSVRDELADIDVPAEIAGLHAEFVEIFGAAAEALDEIGADIREIDPSDDESALFEQITEFGDNLTEEFGSLGTQSDAICFQLQDLADENDIDVDLECGGTE